MSTKQLDETILDEIRSVNFFNGRLLSGEDLKQEQQANRAWNERLGQAIGTGIVYGLEVSKAPTREGEPSAVRIEAGLAINGFGQIVKLDNSIDVSLALSANSSTTEFEGFKNCHPIKQGVEARGVGIYLLVMTPTEKGVGRAEVSGLGNNPAACNIRDIAEGVKFRLVPLDEFKDWNFEDKKLRNRVAYECFGLNDQELRTYRSNPFVFPPPRYGLIEKYLEKKLLTGCDVPLAIIHWTAKEIKFIDMWSVRRGLIASAANKDWEPLLGSRRLREAEALLLQFEEQIRESSVDVRAISHFDYLPPAGLLPRKGNFNEKNFFGSKNFTIQELEEEANTSLVRQVLHESLYLDPFSTNDAITLRVYELAGTSQYILFQRYDKVFIPTPEEPTEDTQQTEPEDTQQEEDAPTTGGLHIRVTNKDPYTFLEVSAYRGGKKYPAKRVKNDETPTIGVLQASSNQVIQDGLDKFVTTISNSEEWIIEGLLAGQYNVKAFQSNIFNAVTSKSASANVNLKAGESLPVNLKLKSHTIFGEDPDKLKPDLEFGPGPEIEHNFVFDPRITFDVNGDKYDKGVLIFETSKLSQTELSKIKVAGFPQYWLPKSPSWLGEDSISIFDPPSEWQEGILSFVQDQIAKNPYLPLATEGFKVIVKPGYKAGDFSQEPYAFIGTDGGMAIPIILTPSDKTLRTEVSISKADILEFKGTNFKQGPLENMDVFAAAWGDIAAAYLGTTIAGAQSFISSMQVEVERALENFSYYPGVSEDMGKSLSDAGFDDVRIANALVDQIAIALGDSFGNDVSARNAFASRLIEQARAYLPSSAWAVKDANLGFNQEELEILEDEEIVSLGDLERGLDSNREELENALENSDLKSNISLESLSIKVKEQLQDNSLIYSPRASLSSLESVDSEALDRLKANNLDDVSSIASASVEKLEEAGFNEEEIKTIKSDALVALLKVKANLDSETATRVVVGNNFSALEDITNTPNTDLEASIAGDSEVTNASIIKTIQIKNIAGAISKRTFQR